MKKKLSAILFLMALLAQPVHAAERATLVNGSGVELGTASNPLKVSGGTNVATKGDLQTYSTTPIALAVGTNGQCLLADSTQTTGLKWGSCAGGASVTFFTDSSTTGHVTYVGCSDDIATAITAATAGDTLELGSCTYNISSGLTIAKSLVIKGQGRLKTIINGSSAISMITVTADNVGIESLSITCIGDGCAGFIVNGEGGTTLTNVWIKDFKLDIENPTNIAGGDAIRYQDAGGLIDNGSIYNLANGMTGTSQSKAIFKRVQTTCDLDTTLDVNKVSITGVGTGTANTLLRGVMNYNQNCGTNISKLNLRNSDVVIQPQDSTTPTNGVEEESPGAGGVTFNIYNSLIDGGTTAASGIVQVDARVDAGTTMNLYNSSLANGTGQINGTLNKYGQVQASGINGSALPQRTNNTLSTANAAVSVLSLTGQKGGDTTIATTGTGGVGGGSTLTGGAGGAADSANTASTGGKGGTHTFTAGAGGTASTATGTNVGGAGGDVELASGAGGNAASGSANTGGNGGNVYIWGAGGGTGSTANGNNGVVVLSRTSGGTIKGGGVCIKCAAPDSGDDIGIDGAAVSTTQRIMGVTRGGIANTAGYHLIMHGGAATSGATNKNGGNLILEPGISTGTGNGTVKVKTNAEGASGTSDNTYVTKDVVGARKDLTSGVAATIAVQNAPSDSWGGGTILYTVVCDDGTNHQAVSGMVTYAWVEKAGVYTKTITENEANQTTVASSGTLTVAWSVSSGLNINVAATTSLTATTLRIYYRIMNHSDNDYTAASPF